MYMIYTTRYNVLHIIITWYNITLLQIYNIYNIIPYKYSIYNFVPFLFPTYFNITNISPWFILDNLLAWELLSQRDICKSRNVYVRSHHEDVIWVWNLSKFTGQGRTVHHLSLRGTQVHYGNLSTGAGGWGCSFHFIHQVTGTIYMSTPKPRFLPLWKEFRNCLQDSWVLLGRITRQPGWVPRLPDTYCSPFLALLRSMFFVYVRFFWRLGKGFSGE